MYADGKIRSLPRKLLEFKGVLAARFDEVL
jgi:hypothetical protein